MKITREEVLKIAELARLSFADSEIDSFTEQFQRILDYIAKLSEVDVEGVEPTSHVSLPERVGGRPLREDLPLQSLEAKDALANAPDPGGDHFKVPRVL